MSAAVVARAVFVSDEYRAMVASVKAERAIFRKAMRMWRAGQLPELGPQVDAYFAAKDEERRVKRKARRK